MDISTELFDKKNVLLGLGDGGAHYGMICDAAYPTFLLTEFVRKGSQGYRMPVEQAVQMLTRQPAEALGLTDRGLLKEGHKGDLNVIRLDHLELRAPAVKRDLPSGGRRLTQDATGFEATAVSGVITYRNGQPTGRLPGRLVRGAQTVAA